MPVPASHSRVLAEVVYAALGQQPRAAPGGGVGATPGSKASATPGPPRPGPLRLVDGLLRRGLDPTAPLWPGGWAGRWVSYRVRLVAVSTRT